MAFNPNISPESRKRLHDALEDVVNVAIRLEFEIVELNLTSTMFEIGLPIVFDPIAVRILDDAPLRFHLNLFPDANARGWPALTDVNAYSRSLAIRRMVQVVEFYEHQHPMAMYVVHPGRRMAPDTEHVDALTESFRTLDSLFPGLPVAVENGHTDAVLSELDTVLEMLDATTLVRFALHTGLAFHSVSGDREAFDARLNYLQRFADRLAEIRWHNTAPGRRPSMPIHLDLERGLDLARIMRTVGRNPGTVHMIETVGFNPAALVREARMLHRMFVP